jgi:hypothetical protein
MALHQRLIIGSNSLGFVHFNMRIRLAEMVSLPSDGSLEDLFHGSELSYDAQKIHFEGSKNQFFFLTLPECS